MATSGKAFTLSRSQSDGDKASPQPTVKKNVRSATPQIALSMMPPMSPDDYDSQGGSYDSDGEPLSTSIERSKLPRGQGQFHLCASMYKRRHGLGRNANTNWVMRCFTVYGPIICYHEEAEIELVTDPSSPRARLNLSKTDTIAEMHSKHKPGLPTEHLLTINIYSIRGKKKWQMCCTSKEQQQQWYSAISAFDGKNTDQQDNQAASPSESVTKGYIRQRAVSYDDTTCAPYPTGDESPFRTSSRSTLDEVELVAKAAAKAADILNEGSEPNITTGHVAVLLIVLNFSSYFIRNGSEQTMVVTLFFMNTSVLYIAFSRGGRKVPWPSQTDPKTRTAKAKKQRIASRDSKSKLHREKSFATMMAVGSTMSRAPTKKDSAIEKLVQTHGSTSSEATRAYSTAGADDYEPKPHSYFNSDPKVFNLRIGPNYKKNKQKAPSGPALYDLHSMDFVYADTTLKNVSDGFRIPTIPGITDVKTGHAHIPPMMIINTWLPAEEPALFGKNKDGETYTVLMVFVLSKDTLEQLKDIENASPGVKLLSEWCRRAEKEQDFRGRFKCMGIVEDIESTGVPKFICGYNGKPALVTKSGEFKRHEGYIEMSVNVHMWAYLAKKGLYALSPRFPDFIVNIGFTIEARSDEELPEVLLGGCRVINLNPAKVIVDGVDNAQK